MGKTSLQNNNKYAGKGTNLRAASLAAAFIMGAGLVMSGCGFTRVAEAAPTDTPEVTQQVKPTPTAKVTKTPAPTPSPSPSPTPYVELTKEQKMELLNIKDPINKYTISQITILKYEIDGCIFYLLNGITTGENPDNMILFDYFSRKNLFITPKNNILGIDFRKIDMTKFDILAPGYLGKDIKFLKVLAMQQFEADMIESGIKIGQSKYSEKINDGYANMSATEVAEYIVDVVPQENIPFPYLYLGLEPYTTPAPSPTATVAPTLFREGSASVKYLTGERDLETEKESESKTRRM